MSHVKTARRDYNIRIRNTISDEETFLAAHAFEPFGQDAGALGNHAIDEFKAGRLTHRELLRHASVLGVAWSTGMLALTGTARAQGAGKPGGTIRIAHMTPAGAVDPLTVTDSAGLSLI